jgi:DNA-binding transcriptional regulator GbsR (MarR family)
MAVLKPRERLVYFRVTEDEFHQFASVCEQEGARSISDLARSAVQRLIAECNREREAERLAPKMELLEKLIAEVTCQLQSLARLRARGRDSDDDTNGRVNGHTSGMRVADSSLEKEE